ncbi:MAG: phenylacetate-CoA oxygenase subunit PaaJ [Anaerolineae bacterium]|nr:phenylacetate-CoA oxygenase subunit PaaJ [Anaerolineae bacterium]MCO5190253.1 phenylacetate-CoA oxygenase subunit PaaJ [Anaerolineae bacterium]MCO5195349.1 phenylacetate-CoA oxygenase subunit PaaJ [Anaerolineae bacterium]MCO5207773.1 phenylacetate-CoA oxygenase subunit PaaJ [Anaerolineae bacterium]
MINDLSAETIYNALNEVMDPEIPVVSLVEMGIIRHVAVKDSAVTVTMTPTFSGCPALIEMQTLIRDKVRELGADNVHVETAIAPPWSSDWITDEGRRKLKQFGLAPPQAHGGNVVMTFFDPVACPRCDGTDTTLKNSFGSTLCRAIWYCNSCQDAFEQFKSL